MYSFHISKKKLLFVGLAFMILLSFSSQTSNVKSAVITDLVYRGYIYDQDAGNTIPGAQVIVTVVGYGSKVVTTDDNGHYLAAFVVDPNREYTANIRANKWGYYSAFLYNLKDYPGGWHWYNLNMDDRGDRVAFFLWSSAVHSSSDIETYRDILIDKGYTTYSSPNPDWRLTIDYLNNWKEDSRYDRVFIFVSGHGNYDKRGDYSWVDLIGSIMISNDLPAKIDDLDSYRITVLVSACYSGDFKDELAGMNYVTVMTGADEQHSGSTNFELKFFSAISQGKSVQSAFNYANSGRYGLSSFNAWSYENI